MNRAETPVVVNADQKVDEDRSLLGGKGAGLFWMASLGLPVPPFFVLTTRAWRQWHEAGRLTDEHIEKVSEMIRWLEQRTGRTLGRGSRPLLVSVRSTGAVSMPGMMDTILNLGIAPDVLGALYQEFGSLKTVADVISNFVDTATPVFGREPSNGKRACPFIPENAEDQLIGAIEGVFASWNNERARLYRRINRIPDDCGTAVVVQAMIFGNADPRSGTGVLFTRNPVTGEAQPTGEWVPAAQGEAIVSGRTTPVPIAELGAAQPAVFDELLRAAARLEREAGAPQDIEFTVERGVLHLLQTRTLKSAPLASCHIALALLDEGIIAEDDAARWLSSLNLDDLATDALVEQPDDGLVVASGLAASPGIARGVVARGIGAGRPGITDPPPLVLVRPETSPHDLPTMRRAAALVTERGGLTSHAAIVARELRIPCVVGCGSLDALRDGQQVTVDGASGRVYAGGIDVETVVPDVVLRARAVVSDRRDQPQAPDPVDRSSETDLLLRVMVHGVVDRDEVLSWSGETPVSPEMISELVAQGVLVADDGLLYVSDGGDELLTRNLRVRPEDEAAFVAFSDEFVVLDREIKSTLTDWQRAQREGDPEGQLVAVEHWLDIDQRLRAAVDRKDAVRRVLGPYLERLDAARQRVLDGETGQLSGAGETSYHSVWFLLHEVLIRSLGRSRQDETP
jgi:pyruvate,orthophosphate dikinase